VLGREKMLSWLQNLHGAEKLLSVPQVAVARRAGALCSGSVCPALTEVLV